MDLLSETFSREARAVVSQLADQLEDGKVIKPIGSFSPSAYDTAWLARIRTRDNEPAWLFPQCFEYLLRTQDQTTGGWPAYSSELDGILNTMAAIVALREHQTRPDIAQGCCSISAEDCAERVVRAENHLRATLQKWDVSRTVHVGFEALVPALLEMLEERTGETLDFPGRQTLMSLYRHKLAKFRPEVLYVPGGKTTLVHSLEAFVGKIDYNRVAHHLDERGSMMASPAATAAYLMHSSIWDERAETYLRDVVLSCSGKGSGGVPSAFPSSTFEMTWVVSTLLKAGLAPDILGLQETSKIRRFLQSQLESHGGLVGFGKFNQPPLTKWFQICPKRMVEEFEAPDHFRTYRNERNESFSANCNVLDALLHSPSPGEYSSQIAKVSRFLCNAFYSGNVRDKWNLSERYSMMVLSQAFAKLLQVWDSGCSLELSEDLICNQIPIVLFQILIRTLQTQSPDGSWGFPLSSGTASREITAYAVLTLKSISSLPWPHVAHFQSRIQAALKRASSYLVLGFGRDNDNEYLWVEKVTYALPPLSRAYSIAALCCPSGTSYYTWGHKVTHLVPNVVPGGERVRKMAKFFSQLPMFEGDEPWLLEADVALGYLYQPQLMRIATNRRNHYPLYNNVLWETMRIALLDYQLDEFMETVVSEAGGGENVYNDLRHIVRGVCEFVPDKNHSFTGPNSSLGNGHSVNGTVMESNSLKHRLPSTDEDVESKRVKPATATATSQTQTPPMDHHHHLRKAESILRRFACYIFQHPAVVSSPKHVRRQLHQELEVCMLAHIDHEEDNSRFITQQSPSDSGAVAKFDSPRGTYYSWIRNTSADNTHSPFTFVFFSCLAAAAAAAAAASLTGTSGPLEGGASFFQGVRQHYLSQAASRHLAHLCRGYNDLGSVARDRAEGNLNSLNFAEFHEAPGGGGGEEETVKKDLFFIATYERECLEHVLAKLNAEVMCGGGGGGGGDGHWKVNALRTFVDTVDLYGQIYMARDITNRVK
ncbi:hypothetical protein QBC46DRAFT_427605 [Diplogelasinospora grovesii]|uniref:Ent-kaurene synthase n=1 Tax=Diplogelasinospora grovesii TaxID=303347 RepID=A0AAN6MWX7_9PEZI|nr:hypothetical protein QBC46DRAFT_427605 [Diplogelasinospora grovesii]